MGLEVVVRPVVLPNIRPAPARSLPPADDPTQGFCEIKGNPAKQVDLTSSWSFSLSRSVNVETERTVDTARVYQQDDDGTVNQDNFVDVDVATRIKSNGGAGFEVGGTGEGGAPDPATLAKARKRNREIEEWYQRQVGTDNIEIRERDKVKKAGDR
jgi:hypothetical protein